MLFAKVGMGQIFELVTPEYKTPPDVNCSSVQFKITNDKAFTVWYLIYYSPTEFGTYTDITTDLTPQGLSIGSTNSVTVKNSGWYKVEFYNGSDAANLVSTSVSLNVLINKVSKGTISGNETICSGFDTQNILSNLDGTGDGTLSYRWEINTNLTSPNWNSVIGASSSTFDPGILNVNSQFRRIAISKLNTFICEAISNIVSKTVNQPPTISAITGANDVCEGLTTTLSNSTNGGVWSSTSPIFTNINSSGLVTGLTSGTSSITYTFTDGNSCSTTVIKSFTVNALPSVSSITGASEVCEGLTTTLSNSTNGGVWSSTSPIFASINSSGLVIGLTSGTTSITYTFTDGNSCSTTVNKSFNVNPLPATPTVNSPTICVGDITTMLATVTPSGTYTYTWQVPVAATAPGNVNSFNTSSSGTYSVTITDNNNCTSAIGSGIVTVNPIPAKPIITSNSPICEGATLTLTTSNVTGGIFSWTGVNSFSSSVQNPSIASITTAASGDYTATVTVDGCTSAASDLISVVVNSKPTITASANKTSICAGESVTLTASGAGSLGTYTWDDGSTSNLISLSTSSSKTYSVTGTDANGCTNSSAVSITVNAIPTFTIIGNAVCAGNPISIIASPATGGIADYNYVWTVPSGATAPGSVPSFSTTVSGIYTGKIKDKNTECESVNQTVTATFYPLPSAAAILASDNKVMEGETLNLTAAASGGTGAYSYTWIPNATTNFTITGSENAIFNAIKEGIVNIKYQVKDANNCLTQSADLAITIAPATIIFELPNAFTPNGDNRNDELKLITNAGVLSLTSLKIFSRSGNLVFESRDLAKGWDGRYNGNLLPIDIYYWTAVYVDRNNVTNSKTGTVLLLK
ncbi:MAG: gliding motility-associated C-terminal domain-containing protein [Sediminibacterium sp.]